MVFKTILKEQESKRKHPVIEGVFLTAYAVNGDITQVKERIIGGRVWRSAYRACTSTYKHAKKHKEVAPSSSKFHHTFPKSPTHFPGPLAGSSFLLAYLQIQEHINRRHIGCLNIL